MKEVAAEGRGGPAGRAAPAVIGQLTDALHVKLVAPREFRAKYAAQAEKLDLVRPRNTWTRLTPRRSDITRSTTVGTGTIPVHYHAIVNTGLLGFEGAAEVVVGLARARGW